MVNLRVLIWVIRGMAYVYALLLIALWVTLWVRLHVEERKPPPLRSALRYYGDYLDGAVSYLREKRCSWRVWYAVLWRDLIKPLLCPIMLRKTPMFEALIEHVLQTTKPPP